MFKIFKSKDKDCCGIVIKEVQEGIQVEVAQTENNCCTPKEAQDNQAESSCCSTSNNEQPCCS